MSNSLVSKMQNKNRDKKYLVDSYEISSHLFIGSL